MKMSKKSILLLLYLLPILVTNLCFSQQLNIKEYCADMTKAQRGGSDYYQKCVDVLEVQRKYEFQEKEKKSKEADRYKEFQELSKKGDFIIKFGNAAYEVVTSRSESDKKRLRNELIEIFSTCLNYNSKGDCDDIAREYEVALFLPTPADFTGMNDINNIPVNQIYTRPDKKKTLKLDTIGCKFASANLSFQQNADSPIGIEAIVTVKRYNDSITYYSDRPFIGMECRETNVGRNIIVFQTFCKDKECIQSDSFGVIDADKAQLMLEPSENNVALAEKITGTSQIRVPYIYSLKEIQTLLSR